jgi:two-component system chemotaxis sensor kinase CheA
VSALREKLLDVFEVEYREHLEGIRQLLAGPVGDGEVDADMTEATRRAHSLKGAARAVGLERVEALAHQLESVFISAGNGETPLEHDLRRFVLGALDDIEDHVVAGRGGAPEPAAQREDAGSDAASAPGAAGDADAAAEAPRQQPRGVAAQGGSVRVNAENLDRLLKSAGELHADMLSQNLGAQEISRLSREVAMVEQQWGAVWKLVAASLRQGAAGSSLSNVLNGGEAVAVRMRSLSKKLRATAQRQNRAARSLHHHLDDLEGRVKSARMVAAESVFGSFRKMVRDVAASEGKQVEVTIDGLDCEADRLVLQRVKDPIMHMLRNAVGHGIETPEERTNGGKPAQGQVALRVSSVHDRLRIVIEDDGRGIDFRRIADKAVEQGRLSREDADAASEEALAQLLFEPGFSTAESVTTISGRGVGLSVAREAVTALQGTFDVHAVPGAGTRIEISLPVSILSRRLLLVAFKDQIYALPSEAVARVMRVGAGGIVTVEGRPAVGFSDSTLPLVSIGELLGFGDPAVATGATDVCVVVVRSNSLQAGIATHIGVAVEGFVGVNDFVVRHLEAGDREDRLWSGVISTEDGEPCLVLNPGAFVKREFGASNVVFRTEQRQTDKAKVVLVVDDSITTRTLEKSILEAHGYVVRLSIDGRDALSQLRNDPPDIVVSDIEMPHVNGLELVQTMKGDRALASIPVVLVTSRADDADREMGLKLGADAYVIKQKFDQNELLRTIRQII